MAWSKECKDPVKTPCKRISTQEKKVPYRESAGLDQPAAGDFVCERLLGRENARLSDVAGRISSQRTLVCGVSSAGRPGLFRDGKRFCLPRAMHTAQEAQEQRTNPGTKSRK